MHAFSTTGAITATITETDIATLDGLSTTSADQLTITVATGAVNASALNIVNGATGLNVTATAVTGITGTAAQFETLMDNEGSTGDKMNLDGDFTVTVSNGTTTAAQLAKIDAKTSKNVDASAVTAISGSASDFTTIAAAQGTGDNQYH